MAPYKPYRDQRCDRQLANVLNESTSNEFKSEVLMLKLMETRLMEHMDNSMHLHFTRFLHSLQGLRELVGVAGEGDAYVSQ